MKRILCLCLVMTALLMLTAEAVEINYASGENIIYKNDFSDYTGGGFAPANWNGYGCWMEVGDFSKAEKDGNAGISAPTAKKARYRLPETMTSGCLYVNFDISHSEEDTGFSYLALQDDSGNMYASGIHDKYVFYADADLGIFYGPAENIGNWGDKSVTLPYEADKVYNVSLICDYSNKKQYMYVDGTLLSMVPFNGINADYTGVSQLVFSFGGVSYADDLHISYMNEESFFAETTVEDGDTVLIEFSEGLSSDDLIFDAEVINTLTNEKVDTAKITKKDFFTYEIKLAENISEGEEYCIKTPKTVTNIIGKELEENICFSKITDDTKLYVSGAETIDYNGESGKLYENIISPSRKIKISFTDKLLQAPTGITSDAGQIESVKLSEDKRSAIIEFAEYFLENGEYELNIPAGIAGEGGKNSPKEYRLTFKTGEGQIKFLNFAFYKNGIAVSKEELSDGDEIVLRAEIIKTVKTAFPAILSYSGWENNMMTKFNFKDLSLSETETSKSGELGIIYESNVKLQGFLRKGLSLINPLADKVEL